MSIGEPYHYCYSCGSKMKVTSRIRSYDGNTGEPHVTYDYKCPNKTGWERFIGHPLTSGEAYAMQAG